jgi:hypothetical protein
MFALRIDSNANGISTGECVNIMNFLGLGHSAFIDQVINSPGGHLFILVCC